MRRATGLGMYEVDWVARRRYWSPELRAMLRVPADLDINADADLLERIVPGRDARALPREGASFARTRRTTATTKTSTASRASTARRAGSCCAAKPSSQDSARRDGVRPARSGSMVDITDRKHGEEANALHASTVLSSSDAIFSIDPDLIIRTWNPGAERLYGYTAAEAIGQLAADDLPGRDPRRAGRALRADDGRQAGAAGDRAPPQGRAPDPGRHLGLADLRARRARSPASRRCIAT